MDSSKIREKWIKHIQAEEINNFKDLRAQTSMLIDLYHGRDDKIVGQNLKTIAKVTTSAIFRSLPEPMIDFRTKSEHRSADDIAYDAIFIQTLKSLLNFALENTTNDGIGDDLGDIIPSIIEESYVTGRGALRVSVGKSSTKALDDIVVVRKIPIESMIWDASGQSWNDVKWICYRHGMSVSEVADLLDINLIEDDNEDDENQKPTDITGSDTAPVSPVYSPFKSVDYADQVELLEIWDKKEGKIIWMLGDCTDVDYAPKLLGDGILKIEEPSVKFPDFFDVVILTHQRSFGSTIPSSPVSDYLHLLQQLSHVNAKLNENVSLLGLRGFYSKMAFNEFARLSEIGDISGLIPVAVEKITDAKLGDLIWQMDPTPMLQAIPVLAAQRDQITEEIYRISGISDLLQGFQSPNETATATVRKEKFGQNRLVESQQLLDRFFVNVFSKLLFASCMLSKKSIMAITDLQYSDDSVQLIKNIRAASEIDLKINLTASVASMEALEKDKTLQAYNTFVNMGLQLYTNAPPEMAKLTHMILVDLAKTLGLGDSVIEEINNIAKNNQEMLKSQEIQQQQQSLPVAQTQVESSQNINSDNTMAMPIF